jgi:transcriptional regulator GlxA family with amidase domain
MPRDVVIVIFDGVQPLDAVGPHEVFVGANEFERAAGRAAPYRVAVAASSPGPVRAASGLGLFADSPLPPGPIDTLLVAGGDGARRAQHDGALLDWLRRSAPTTRRVCSVCTGAFVLAAAGLLDGKPATTHWARAEALAAEYPAVAVEPEPLFLRAGKIWTSAGVTAGIDLALALVEDDLGPAAAQTVARWLVLFLRRSGGQSQFAAEVWSDPPERTALRDLVRHIHAEPGGDLRLPALARRAAMSVRHLQRTFTRDLGEPPSRYVSRVRVTAARRLLELEPVTVAAAARQCGFGSAESMRRAFQRQLGICPDTYRDRFRPPPLRERPPLREQPPAHSPQEFSCVSPSSSFPG